MQKINCFYQNTWINGEKNSKYFFNLEKQNHRQKHIKTLKKEDDTSVSNAKQILGEEVQFFKQIYESKTTSPEDDNFKFLCDPDCIKTLESEECDSCEGLLTLGECTDVLSSFCNDKTPGSDGLMIEFYHFFWSCIGQCVVDSFNYACHEDGLSISQKLGIISLIPKKNKSLEHLKNWRPISLLNTDYKIATKTIAVRLEKVLPSIIHPCQTGYIKGRYIGECIRLISDTMSFTKQRIIPGAVVFLDFEKAFDSIEWNYMYLQKCLKVFNLGPQFRRQLRHQGCETTCKCQSSKFLHQSNLVLAKFKRHRATTKIGYSEPNHLE